MFKVRDFFLIFFGWYGFSDLIIRTIFIITSAMLTYTSPWVSEACIITIDLFFNFFGIEFMTMAIGDNSVLTLTLSSPFSLTYSELFRVTSTILRQNLKGS